MIKSFDKLQSVLSFEGCKNFQFIGDGTGKIGTTGFLLGLVGGELNVKTSFTGQYFYGKNNLYFCFSISAFRTTRGLYSDVCAHLNVWRGADDWNCITRRDTNALVDFHHLFVHVSFFRVLLDCGFSTISIIVWMWVELPEIHSFLMINHRLQCPNRTSADFSAGYSSLHYQSQ